MNQYIFLSLFTTLLISTHAMIQSNSYSTNNELADPTNNISYYAAIFEFAQGSCPRTVWENNVKLWPNSDSFLQFIINTPQDITSASSKSPPTFIRSNFEGAFFLAIFFLIPDSQARGFSRPYALAFAHLSQDPINYLYYNYQETLLSFISDIQKRPFEVFTPEIIDYTISLQAILKGDNSSFGLNSKLEELRHLLPLFGINSLPEKEPIYKDPSYFTSINNNLRPIETFTDIGTVIPRIEQFLNTIPANFFQTNVLFEVYPCSSGLLFATNILNGHFPFYCDPKDDIYKFSSLISNHIFTDILFSLLSGRILAIVASNTSGAQAFAYRLSICYPFNHSFNIRLIEEDAPISLKSVNQITPNNSTSGFHIDLSNTKSSQIFESQNLSNSKFNIEGPSILPESGTIFVMSNNPKSHPLIDILNLDTLRFFGSSCPSSSILTRELGKIPTNNENFALTAIFNDVHRIGTKFLIKMGDISGRNEQTRDMMLEAMEHIGFSREDEPIISFWVYLLKNENGPVPIPIEIQQITTGSDSNLSSPK